jgi:hypothetical protein
LPEGARRPSAECRRRKKAERQRTVAAAAAGLVGAMMDGQRREDKIKPISLDGYTPG